MNKAGKLAQGSNPSPNQASTNSLYLDPEIHTTPTRSEK